MHAKYASRNYLDCGAKHETYIWQNNTTNCEDLQVTFEFSIAVFEAKQGNNNNLPFCFESFCSKESALMVFDTRVIFLLAAATI